MPEFGIYGPALEHRLPHLAHTSIARNGYGQPGDLPLSACDSGWSLPKLRGGTAAHKVDPRNGYGTMPGIEIATGAFPVCTS